MMGHAPSSKCEVATYPPTLGSFPRSATFQSPENVSKSLHRELAPPALDRSSAQGRGSVARVLHLALSHSRDLAALYKRPYAAQLQTRENPNCSPLYPKKIALKGIAPRADPRRDLRAAGEGDFAVVQPGGAFHPKIPCSTTVGKSTGKILNSHGDNA